MKEYWLGFTTFSIEKYKKYDIGYPLFIKIFLIFCISANIFIIILEMKLFI